MKKTFLLLILNRERQYTMIYNCKIIDIDEEEITLKIGDVCITGFVNRSVNKKIGEEVEVDISLYDDLKITQCNENKFDIERKGKTFKYTLFGILDIDNAVLKSIIDFKIDEAELYDYGYLDGVQVKVDVLRIDFDFNCT